MSFEKKTAANQKHSQGNTENEFADYDLGNFLADCSGIVWNNESGKL